VRKKTGSLDWHKIVMGGVVLLGGYAVYRMVQAPATTVAPTEPDLVLGQRPKV
jgi:hypothetical protein